MRKALEAATLAVVVVLAGCERQAVEQPTSATAGSAGSEPTFDDAKRGTGQSQQQDTQPPAQQQAATGQSQDTEQQQAGMGTGQGQVYRSVVGTVESVAQNSLTLKNRLGESHEFVFDEKTRFTQDGRATSRDAIREGAEVRAVFRGEAPGPLETIEIRVKEQGPQQ